MSWNTRSRSTDDMAVAREITARAYREQVEAAQDRFDRLNKQLGRYPFDEALNSPLIFPRQGYPARIG